MKKLYIPLLFIIAIALSNCKKDAVAFDKYVPEVGDIDSIYFSATDKMLVADGKASLNFLFEAYRKVKLTSGKDTMYSMDITKLPEGAVKVFDEVSGKEVSKTFTTTSVAQPQYRFYAMIGGMKSATQTVVIRPVPALAPKVYVDVIFHVWELNTAHISYDPSSYKDVQYSDIVLAVKNLNDQFNNKIGNSPTGGSANMEFRLAAKNQAGQTLEKAGYNRVTYSDNVKVNPLAISFTFTDYTTFITNNVATLIWNPKQYLNIHVIPYGASTSMGTAFPAKKLPGASPAIADITVIAANDDDYLKTYAAACTAVPRTAFFPGYERKIEMANYIGSFYGLYPTQYNATRTYSDYCPDTRIWNSADLRNSSLYITKFSVDNIKFFSDNAMDLLQSPSLRSNFSIDQCTRMRAVLESCPGRMNGKPQ